MVMDFDGEMEEGGGGAGGGEGNGGGRGGELGGVDHVVVLDVLLHYLRTSPEVVLLSGPGEGGKGGKGGDGKSGGKGGKGDGGGDGDGEKGGGLGRKGTRGGGKGGTGGGGTGEDEKGGGGAGGGGGGGGGKGDPISRGLAKALVAAVGAPPTFHPIALSEFSLRYYFGLKIVDVYVSRLTSASFSSLSSSFSSSLSSLPSAPSSHTSPPSPSLSPATSPSSPLPPLSLSSRPPHQTKKMEENLLSISHTLSPEFQDIAQRLFETSSQLSSRFPERIVINPFFTELEERDDAITFIAQKIEEGVSPYLIVNLDPPSPPRSSAPPPSPSFSFTSPFSSSNSTPTPTPSPTLTSSPSLSSSPPPLNPIETTFILLQEMRMCGGRLLTSIFGENRERLLGILQALGPFLLPRLQPTPGGKFKAKEIGVGGGEGDECMEVVSFASSLCDFPFVFEAWRKPLGDIFYDEFFFGVERSAVGVRHWGKIIDRFEIDL